MNRKTAFAGIGLVLLAFSGLVLLPHLLSRFSLQPESREPASRPARAGPPDSAPAPAEAPPVARGPLPAPREDGPASDRALAVQVVDAAGTPVAGVPLRICRDPDRFEGKPAGHARTQGPHGIARFPGIAGLLDAIAPPGSHRRAVLTFDFPLPKEGSPTVPLASGSLPADPVRLTLPPTGRVAVRLLDGDGAPLARPARGYLDTVSLRYSYQEKELTAQSALPAAAGRLAFPFVGLGLELELAVFVEGRVRVARNRISGPANPGEEAVLSLTCPFDDVVCGQAVDGSGIPWANTTLAIGLPYHPGEPIDQAYDFSRRDSGERIRTDEAGRFRFVLPDSVAVEPYHHLWLRVEDGSPPQQAPGGRLALSPPFPGGERQVGPVVLTRARLVAAGLVRDGEGKPLAKVRVTAGSPQKPSLFGATATGPDGRFALYSRSTATTIAVVAALSGWGRLAREDLPFGANDLEFVLNRQGSLAGSALLEPECARSPGLGIAIDVRIRAQDHPPTRALVSRSPEGFQFRAGDLPPGLCEVVICLVTRPPAAPVPPLATIPDVLVRSGEECRDPRLQKVDLRGRLLAFSLTVTDDQGEPVEWATLDGHGVCWPDPNTLHTLLLRDKPLDLVVRARGFRPQRIRDAPPGARVILERGILVPLALEPPPALQDPLLSLAAGQFPEYEKGVFVLDSMAQRVLGIFINGYTFIRVQEPGRQQVQLFLRKQSGLRTLLTQVGLGEIDVPEEPGSRPIPLRILPGALAAAQERLKDT